MPAANRPSTHCCSTDHDTLAARYEGWEGYHDGLLLLVGFEVSPKQGHYLAFGTEHEIPH